MKIKNIAATGLGVLMVLSFCRIVLATDWADNDRFFKGYCENMYGTFKFKTKIPCKIDHASFDKGNISPADNYTNPNQLCGPGNLNSIVSPNLGWPCAGDPQCGPAFTKAVKKIICIYSETDRKLVLKKDGTLQMFVTKNADSPDAWAHDELDKLFGFKNK
jgi:hypothetical protein